MRGGGVRLLGAPWTPKADYHLMHMGTAGMLNIVADETLGLGLASKKVAGYLSTSADCLFSPQAMRRTIPIVLMKFLLAVCTQRCPELHDCADLEISLSEQDAWQFGENDFSGLGRYQPFLHI